MKNTEKEIKNEYQKIKTTMENYNEIKSRAQKSLFQNGYKKITGDINMDRDGTVNIYNGGDGSTFADMYDEYELYAIGFMANTALTVFEAWDMIKDRLENDQSLKGFLGLIEPE